MPPACFPAPPRARVPCPPANPAKTWPQTQTGLHSSQPPLDRPRFCRTAHRRAAFPPCPSHRSPGLSGSSRHLHPQPRAPSSHPGALQHAVPLLIASTAGYRLAPTCLRPRPSRCRTAHISSDLPHDAGLRPFTTHAATIARRRAGAPAEYPAAVDITRARDAAASRFRKLGQVEWQRGPEKAKCESPCSPRRTPRGELQCFTFILPSIRR